jgi:hypothetical protein
MMWATRGNLCCGVLPQLRTAILKDGREGCSQNFEIALRGIHSTGYTPFQLSNFIPHLGFRLGGLTL